MRVVRKAGAHTNVEVIEPGRMLAYVIKEKCGETGIKNGLKLRNLGVPILLRTVAPAPCSRKVCKLAYVSRIGHAVDILRFIE